MIMEKIAGKELGNQRLKMIGEVMEIEALLLSTRLWANVSIYYISTIWSRESRAQGQWHRSSWTNRRILYLPREPYYRLIEDLVSQQSSRCMDIISFVFQGYRTSSCGKGTSTAAKYARRRFPFEPLYREIYDYQKEDPADHARILPDFLRVADHFKPEPRCIPNRPTIHPPDLDQKQYFHFRFIWYPWRNRLATVFHSFSLFQASHRNTSKTMEMRPQKT